MSSLQWNTNLADKKSVKLLSLPLFEILKGWQQHKQAQDCHHLPPLCITIHFYQYNFYSSYICFLLLQSVLFSCALTCCCDCLQWPYGRQKQSSQETWNQTSPQGQNSCLMTSGEMTTNQDNEDSLTRTDSPSRSGSACQSETWD